MEAILLAWKAIPAWARFSLYGFIVGLAVGAFVMHKIDSAIDTAQEAWAGTIVGRIERKVDKATSKVEEESIKVEQQTQFKDRVIYREVIKYVPKQEDPNCPALDVGTVRMLNLARYARTVEDVMRATSGLDAATASALTSVTRVELIESDIEIALMYNQLAGRFNLLVDFIEAQQKAIGNK